MAADREKHLWYTRRDGVVQGPFPAGLLRRYVVLGRTRVTDEVSPDRVTWRALAEVESLVPEELRGPHSQGSVDRLQAARLREDERQLGDRRAGTEPPAGVERRAGDRRASEPPEMLQHRRLREQVLAEHQPAPRPRTGLFALAVAVSIAAVAGTVYWLIPADGPAGADCTAWPAPGVDWSHCRKPGLLLGRANLRGAKMRSADLNGSDLSGALLGQADLSYANLSTARLRAADLREAVLTGADLRGADLDSADLRDADLSYANLAGARGIDVRLERARLDKAIWIDGRTCAPGSFGQCLLGN